MTAPIGALSRPAATRVGADADTLLGAAKQLESVFVRQLYAAMRETVHDDEGIMSAGSGGETFQTLIDDAIAEKTPQQWKHGLAEAVARQFARRAQAAEIPPAPAGAPPLAP